MSSFDHLAIAAETLTDGAAYVERALGAPLATGGEHPLMGTHNRLLSLGPEAYLEVIAINPAAPAPTRPRWFGLDAFSGRAVLQSFVVQVPDLAAALRTAPAGSGQPVSLARGDLRWRMAIPDTGQLPYDGVFPALIEWQGTAHPAPRLPDHGVRLHRLTLVHPDAAELRRAVARIVTDARIVVESGPAPALRAEFDTPHGVRFL